MAKPKREKQPYKVLLTSLGIHLVLVEGYSAEDACRTLARKIAGKPIRRTRVVSRLLEDLWSEPSDKEGAWIVSAASRHKMNPPEVMSWDGESIKSCLPEGLVWSVYQGASKGSAKPFARFADVYGELLKTAEKEVAQKQQFDRNTGIGNCSGCRDFQADQR